MGFTTGLLGGITLTTSLLYLSLRLHTDNRAHQSALLRQQSTLLQNIVAPPPPTPAPLPREVRAGVLESAKDRWNAELERNVRSVQNVDWEEWGRWAEDGVSRVWRRAFKGSREAVDRAAGNA
ncbi:hypothetical protein LTR95_002317 [Oleoguttula sp. CCFEE 5521]